MIKKSLLSALIVCFISCTDFSTNKLSIIGNWEIAQFMRNDSAGFTLYPPLTVKDPKKLFTIFYNGELCFLENDRFVLENPIGAQHTGKWNFSDSTLTLTISNCEIATKLKQINTNKIRLSCGDYQMQLIKK